MTSIPESFVLPEEHRPHVRHDESSVNEQIPTVDLTPLQEDPDGEAANEAIKKIGQACEQWGFFQVVGHGVPLELLEKVKKEALTFFSLPLEEKSKVRRSIRNSYGYYDTELTKNVRDWKEVFDFTRKRHLDLPDDDSSNQTITGWNQFPDNPPEFRVTMENWYSAIEALAYNILGYIARSLGLSATCFHHYFADHTSKMRLNHYPKCPDPSLALGVSRHKDPGAVTVLVQDEVGGLQVWKKDGNWIGVEPQRGAFVINVGDIFQVWSNDKYQSVEHRVVVNENKDRFSVPFFFSPSHDTDYAPVPKLLEGQNAARYRAINWGEFSRKRNDGNFADFGEEIQIHHYAVEQ